MNWDIDGFLQRLRGGFDAGEAKREEEQAAIETDLQRLQRENEENQKAADKAVEEWRKEQKRLADEKIAAEKLKQEQYNTRWAQKRAESVGATTPPEEPEEEKNVFWKWLGNLFKPKEITENISPTPTPNLLPPEYTDIPKINMDSRMILDEPIATASAKQYLDKIFTDYLPKTPDVPEGWRSPLLDYTQPMAEAGYDSRVHPAIQALMAIAETQAMRPAASGTQVQNPYNIMQPGTQKLHDYTNNGGIERAVRRFPENITNNWQNDNIKKWRENPTMQGFISAFNPIDNPEGEMKVVSDLIKQLGL